MEESVILWLCESGGFDKIRELCGAYKNNSKGTSLFQFILPLDILDLLQYNVELGQLVLHQPSAAWPLFQEVCFKAIKLLEWLPSVQSSSQLMLLMRLTTLPNLPSYKVSHARDLPSAQEEPRFYQVSGRVVSMSLPEQYTEQAVFVCSTEGCNGRCVSVHVVGASETLTTAGNRRCPMCGRLLIEDVSCRTLEDRVNLIMTCNEYGQSSNHVDSHCRLQGIMIIVRKDLCKHIQLGSMVTVIGVPTYATVVHAHHLFIETTFEANNIFVDTVPVGYSISSIPSSICEIKRACAYSPWLFLQTLGYSFADDICPSGCFHRLKTLILLSLVCPLLGHQGTKEQEYGSLDLMVCGSDCVYLSQLLQTGSELAFTAVQHTSHCTLVAQQWKDTSTTYIDSGSLLLADKGVCVVRNLQSFKKDTRTKLQRVLETDQLTISFSHQPRKSQNQSWSKSCTVWAHMELPSHGKTAQQESDESQEAPFLKGMADAFGLVVMTDPPDIDTRDYVHDLLMQRTISSSKRDVISNALPLEDLQHYLQMAMSIEAELLEDASDLLRAFYMASRRTRSSSVEGPDVPIQTLKSLKSIACAHAKLNLRKKATVEDAVLSIYFCEESLTSYLGYSVIGVHHCPHFKPNVHSASYMGVEFHDYMSSLHEQILEFCKYQGVSSFMNEE